MKCEGKHNTLTDERQEMLEDMGFVWDSHNASWESKFDELCDFKRVHGHSFVPTIFPENPQLAAWIKVRSILDRGTRKWTIHRFVSVVHFTALQRMHSHLAFVSFLLAFFLQCQRRQLRIFHGVMDGPCETPSSEDVAIKAIKSTLSPQRVQKLLQIGLRWKKKGVVVSAMKHP